MHSCTFFSYRQNNNIWSGLLLLMNDLWPCEMHKTSSNVGRLLGAVIGLYMCKTAFKHLLPCVVDLCCGFGPWGYLTG